MLFGIAVGGISYPEAGVAQSQGSGNVRTTIRHGVIKVEAYDSSVPDIIDDLARRLGFEVRGERPGADVHTQRSLEGTLDELLGNLLHDANYVLVTEAGTPKQLIILPPGPAVAQPAQTYPSMSVEQMRKKEGELVAQIAQYEDMRNEARERANLVFARKLEKYVEKLTAEAEAIRAHLPPH